MVIVIVMVMLLSSLFFYGLLFYLPVCHANNDTGFLVPFVCICRTVFLVVQYRPWYNVDTGRAVPVKMT